MSKSIIIILLVPVLLGSVLHAQSVPDSVYYKRLYYTGKVWGFIKYFHSEVAKGDINWDLKLIETLLNVKGDISNQDFNESLSNLLDMAGDMALPTFWLPEVSDSLKYNLDLNWLMDTIFSDEVRARLDTIKTRFRKQNNYFIEELWKGGNATFDNDNQFYEWGVNQYPSEEYRLLALFRYWNIINYFYPYKYIMDQNWDSTLVEFIPRMVNAQDEISLHLAFLELATRLNDSHASTYSDVINEQIIGLYYLPLTLGYVENETIITGVFTDNEEIKNGGIIKYINGMDIYALRDSLSQFTTGSNNPVIERNINSRILRGPNEVVKMTVENSEGQKDISLLRSIRITDYSNLIAEDDSIWKILHTNFRTYGYVDMGRLEVEHIDLMFNDLWDTDALIFDIRNYPQGTMWYMIRYLFDSPIHIANFTVPDIRYPGTLYWHYETVGTGDFSNTYNKPIFILFDERTQSQAEYTIMAFEQHPKAIKIGSQTSGADGNVSILYLPGGIMSYYTGLGVFYPDFTETQRIGIIPDIEIHPTIAGIREGRDEVLEAALEYNITNIAEDDYSNTSQIPKTYLIQNYPNPFNASTIIGYQVGATSKSPLHVELSVYNLLGQKVAMLVSEEQNAGVHSIEWDAGNLSSGVYYYMIKAGDWQDVKKMVLLK